jgi:hypothetical protein
VANFFHEWAKIQVKKLSKTQFKSYSLLGLKKAILTLFELIESLFQFLLLSHLKALDKPVMGKNGLGAPLWPSLA